MKISCVLIVLFSLIFLNCEEESVQECDDYRGFEEIGGFNNRVISSGNDSIRFANDNHIYIYMKTDSCLLVTEGIFEYEITRTGCQCLRNYKVNGSCWSPHVYHTGNGIIDVINSDIQDCVGENLNLEFTFMAEIHVINISSPGCIELYIKQKCGWEGCEDLDN